MGCERMTRPGLSLCLCLWAGGAAALDLPENAVISRETQDGSATLALPVTAWSEESIDFAQRDGTVTRRAWRIPQSSLTTLQALEPIRQDLEERGFSVLFECETRVCGGFDFRFALDLLPEPEMHVNLGDFRYLAAERAGSEELIGVVISRGAGDLFLHEAHVTASASADTPVEPKPIPAPRAPEASLSDPEPSAPVIAGRNDDGLTGQLETQGHVVLEDLEFATGSAALEPRAFGSLVELAAWLNATPDATIVLVGHSDATGALAANVALSRQRAQSVVDRLVSAHDVAPGQLRAEGIGYLAPLASNATPEGRARNRRVEAVFVDPG